MFKGTIALKDGNVVQVECASVTEFATLVTTLNGGGRVAAPETVKRLGGRPRVKGPRDSKGRLIYSSLKVKGTKRATRKARVEWSERDLLSVADIVKRNLDLKSGISSMAITYIRKQGDFKKRDKGTIYSMVCDVKAYLNGDKNAVRLHHREVLERNGFTPRQQLLED